MRTMKNLALATMAATALALAGCGGGGSGTNPGSASSGSDCPDGQVMGQDGTCMTPEPPGPTTAELALDARTYAEEAKTAGAQAAKDAAKYAGMLTALSVSGDSAMAGMNAGKVFMAQTMLEYDIDMAEKAVEAASAAMDGASDADEATLQAAIDVANAAIAEAKKSLTAVMAEVNKIDGTDKEPKMAADYAMDVAKAIGMLLDDNPAANTATMVSLTTVPVALTDSDDTNDSGDVKDNSMGMTFAELAPASMSMRVGGDSRQVLSLEGMTATDIAADLAAVAAGSDNDDAVSATSPTYKGIGGTVHCLSDDGCEITDGALGSGWYFAIPVAMEMTKYVMKDGETTYSPEMYASYGYWLNENDHDSDPTTAARLELTTFAHSDSTTGTPDLAADTGDPTKNSATYKGMAEGLSMMKQADGKGGFTGHKSASFTADVTLEAVFAGATSKLSGTIGNFVGDAANTQWSVELGDLTLASNDGTDSGTTKANADGMWSARTYGAASERPAGVLGVFNAHFSDGHAAGGFATRVAE